MVDQWMTGCHSIKQTKMISLRPLRQQRQPPMLLIPVVHKVVKEALVGDEVVQAAGVTYQRCSVFVVTNLVMTHQTLPPQVRLRNPSLLLCRRRKSQPWAVDKSISCSWLRHQQPTCSWMEDHNTAYCFYTSIVSSKDTPYQSHGYSWTVNLRLTNLQTKTFWGMYTHRTKQLHQM